MKELEKTWVLEQYRDNIEEVQFSSKLMGSTFIPGSQECLRYLKDNYKKHTIDFKLEREPDNEHDEFAVKVLLSISGPDGYHKLGYVPKEEAPTLSYVLENPKKYIFQLDGFYLSGGSVEKENVGLFFDYHILRNLAQ